MEQLNFVHLPRYRVLLCNDHGGCVSKKRFKKHVWALHAARGEIVQIADLEVQALDIAEPQDIDLPPPSHAPIPGLKVFTFFRCLVSGCSQESTACSQREETVRKHQSKVHKIHHKKGIDASSTIELISMQSFFQPPLQRWFQVLSPPAPALAAAESPADCIQQPLRTLLAASEQSWVEQFQSFADQDELHASQTPPGLLPPASVPSSRVSSWRSQNYMR